MKIKRKLHNKMFKHRQLKFWQYSVISDTGSLDCYYHTWFITLVFIPCMIIGMFTDGIIPTMKELIALYKVPYSSDWLSTWEMRQLTRLK